MWQWCIWLYMIFVLSNVMMKPSNVSKIGVPQNVTIVWSYVMFVLSNVTLTSSNVRKKKKKKKISKCDILVNFITSWLLVDTILQKIGNVEFHILLYTSCEIG